MSITERELKVSTSTSGEATVISMTLPPGAPEELRGSLQTHSENGPLTKVTLPPLSLDEVKELRAELDQVIEHAERKPEPWKK